MYDICISIEQKIVRNMPNFTPLNKYQLITNIQLKIVTLIVMIEGKTKQKFHQ